MGKFEILGRRSAFWPVFLLGFALVMGRGAQGWSKEGHIMTCRIAQVILIPPFLWEVGFSLFSAALLFINTI